MAVLQFLTNQADKVEGLAYAGFETFRGSPYTSCARETGQNSRDAVSNDDKVVQVTFKLLEVPRSELPFADTLQNALNCCLRDPQDDKTERHLKRALETIVAPSIKVLEIADYNTTGLTGPTSDPHSVFSALVKGDGVTQKDDPTSAGSYGIGKNAAYAVSNLQAVVYSTRWHDQATGASRFATQGRLRLISHTDGQMKFSAEGYWGNSGFKAIEDESDAPSWVRRSEIGTSVFAVGFHEHENWADRMLLSLTTNFFLAIDRKEIEFTVGDLVLNHATLDEVLSSTALARVAEASDQGRALKLAKRLLRCVRSEVATTHNIHVQDLGDFSLHLLVAEGLPREVHVLRNGIYITDNFAKFKDRLQRFPGTREFTALLEPARSPNGTAASTLLKELENPKHDEFEPERIVDETEQENARRQINDLIGAVRGVIRETASVEDVEESQLDELSRMFSQAGGNPDVDREDGELDPETVRYGEARRGTHQTHQGSSSRSGEDSGKGTNRANEHRKHSGKGKGSKKPAGFGHAIALRDVRAVIPGGGNDHQRTIHFTPGVNGAIELRVEAAGLSSDTPIRIAHADIGQVKAGRVRADVSADERMSISVSFEEPFTGPIELMAITRRAAQGSD